MKVQILIEDEHDQENDPDIEEENKSRLLMTIHKRFPGAIWQRGSGGQGFEVFI